MGSEPNPTVISGQTSTVILERLPEEELGVAQGWRITDLSGLEWALERLGAANAEIAALQPAVAQVEALRRGLNGGNAGREVLAREQEHTADVLQVLETLTRILPDDSFLTDFALRDRHVTISGRSASAPGLITGLSAEPSIKDAAFAAPVTRIEGATADVFSIGAEVRP